MDVKPKKIEITGLRKRWLISSLSPILVVLLLVAGTFCAGMANYYYNMMLDGLKTRATHASDYFNNYSMNTYASFYQAAATYTADAIRRHGAIPSLELSHSGMYSGTYMTDKSRQKD